MGELGAFPLGPAASVLLAALPLLWILVGLGSRRFAAHTVCLSALALGFVIAATLWRMPVVPAARAALEGVVLALWPILWVIFAALFTFNTTVATGAFEDIQRLLSQVGGDRRIQALLIAWGFGGFLEGTAGFGTAVAISAAILIGLGFEARRAAVVSLLANTAPVVFGGAGLPIITLGQVTGLDARRLAVQSALQLAPLVLMLPVAIVLVVTRRISGLRGAIGAALVAGLGFGGPALLLASRLGPELPTIVGSLCAMLLIALWARLSPPGRAWRFENEGSAPIESGPRLRWRSQLTAWSPYLLMLVLILSANAVAPLRRALAAATVRAAIYTGPGSSPLSLPLLLTPGTLIFIAALLGGVIQGASPREFASTLARTSRQLATPALTVIALVALARLLAHSGMITAVAVAVAAAAGRAAPFVAPWLGALGAFVTGSDTSSNVLFGALQVETARRIGADTCWMAAANATGATAGKMISPQSIAVAVAATGQSGAEGRLLRTMLPWCAVYALLLGLLVLAAAPAGTAP